MNLTERIESVILSNLQPADERKIGVECECFFYDNKQRRIPVNPGGRFSSTDLLNELIDLQSDDEIKAGYSLEPGGQLEWASPPMKSLHEINTNYLRNKARVLAIAKCEKLTYIDFSLEPLYSPTDIELIDHKKYNFMDKMFSKTGKLGPWMMRNTASIQINIDFSSQEEAEKMAYIADCITPLASILFANSPFWKGKLAGTVNLRYKIWNDTDGSRCGDLMDHGIRSSKNLLKRYAQYIQTVPTIFIEENNGNINNFEGTLGEWLSGLETTGKLTDDNIQVALHQIFTHVRFKNVLEIRGADKPLAGYEFAPAAFWVGLLLDNETQNEVFNIVKKWSLEDRHKLILSAYVLDLTQIGPEKKSIAEWIQRFSELSLNGLHRRSKKEVIQNETSFLKEYMTMFNSNGIPALHTQEQIRQSGKTLRDFIR